MRNWKKLTVLLMAAVLVLTSVPELSVYAALGDESKAEITGEEFTEDVLDNDYLATPDLVIKTCEELNAFAKSVNNGNNYEGKLVCLGADITFDGVTENNFTTIGRNVVGYNKEFKGTFDGAGYTISGIVQKPKKDEKGFFYDVGLFYNLSGTLKDLTLKECTFVNRGTIRRAGMVNENNGSIKNCKVVDCSFDGEVVGAIAGRNDGSIENCRNINSSVKTNRMGGGIVGYNTNNIVKCWSSGRVTAMCDESNPYNEECSIGGIVGHCVPGKSYPSMKNCANVGSVSVVNKYRSSKEAGGLTGYAFRTTFENCYNAGKVNSLDEKNNKLGGLIGHTDPNCTLKNCYFSTEYMFAAHGEPSEDYPPVETNVCGKSDAEMRSASFTALLNSGVSDSKTWINTNESPYPQLATVYPIRVSCDDHGVVSSLKEYAYPEDKVSFVVYPDSNYKTTDVSVTTKSGKTVEVTASDDYRACSFIMPAEDVTISASFAISMPLQNCSASLAVTHFTYDGKAKTPAVTVKNGNTTLVQGTDYRVEYSSNINAGTGVVTITGLGGYTGSKQLKFTIDKATQTISGGAASYDKTVGMKPFSLKTKLKSGVSKLTYKTSDKKVATVSNTGKVTIKGAGCAKITVTAKGTENYYEAVKTCTVTVKPKKATIRSLKVLSGRKLQVNWKADTTVTGYMVEYATTSNFKNAKKTYVTGAKKTSTVLKGLAVGKRYYVRVSSYKEATVNGAKKKIFSDASKALVSGKVKK